MTDLIFLVVPIVVLLIIPLNAMAQPSPYAATQFGYIPGFVKNAPMPIDTKTASQNAIIKSALWYLNATVHNYHIKGFIENTVPSATRLSISINFWDDATGVRLAPSGDFTYEPSGGVPANLTISYDMTTGYNASYTNVFKTVYGLLS